MQLKQSIVETFNRKGYFLTSMITQRQFHILMNTFIASSHTVFDESITQEIWKQSTERNQQLYGKSALANSSEGNQQQQLLITTSSKQKNQPIAQKNHPIAIPTTIPNKKQPKPELKCQIIISTLIDAIQILTNRILQCQQHLQDLKFKRQQLQQNQNYSKLESIKQKIQSINQDLKQFQKEFKMLSSPFLTDGSKQQLKKQLSIKRSQTLKKRSSIQKDKAMSQQMENADHQQQQSQQSHIYSSNYRYRHKNNQQDNQSNAESPTTSRMLRKSPFKEQKHCGMWMLGLLSILQLSVCLIKFNFVNLLVELLGFLVLVEENYLPSMMKASLYSCIFSVTLDVGWLLVYSPLYIHPYTNTSIHRSLKPYHYYIWFATLLQLFIKLTYLYVLRSYSNKTQSFHDQQRKKQQERSNAEIDNKYISQIKNIANFEQ